MAYWVFICFGSSVVKISPCLAFQVVAFVLKEVNPAPSKSSRYCLDLTKGHIVYKMALLRVFLNIPMHHLLLLLAITYS